MEHKALFRFHDSLNNFLTHSQKNTPVTYRFNNLPAVKDAIEAIGIPHPEIAAIVINGLSVSLLHPLRNGDEVHVYPVDNLLPEDAILYKQPPLYRFILDVHLGKLSRALRLLGFDVLYQNDYNDEKIAAIAENENRIVLTRDTGLLKRRSVTWGYWLRSQKVEEQVVEVINHFTIADHCQPFTRCLTCNGTIAAADRETVLPVLPPKTAAFFHLFFRCSSCKQVYWQGSHYHRMQQFIDAIKKGLQKSYCL